MSTYMANAQNTVKAWRVVDAADKTLGRLATVVATHLRGKHRPDFTPHADVGDNIVVINADKVKVSGNKAQKKVYHRHTEHPGGLKTETFEKLHARAPERVIEMAVKGMLPKGPLGRDMYRKLHVYAGDQHPHGAQQPTELSIEE